ncbi:hypothetical protein BKA62DRAFT_394658 [Auriculariales sp. MPI-PUGE-AT-0066]|nr:hypothetical protein BKA62DRAFT_394658 [Auriculariales sp. MPI-PUGE-AT-0066]
MNAEKNACLRSNSVFLRLSLSLTLSHSLMQRASSLIRATPRAFAPALSNRAYSLSKLQLIGRLTHDPEVRMSKNDKEYVSYTVATTNYPPPPPNPDGCKHDCAKKNTLIARRPNSISAP